VLFRPEEVVLPSSASTVHNGLFRVHLNKVAPVHFDVDTLYTMGAGIIKGYAAVLVLAADQQQEVHRSRNPKALPRVQGHRMKGEPKPFQEPLMIIRQRIASRTSPVRK